MLEEKSIFIFLFFCNFNFLKTNSVFGKKKLLITTMCEPPLKPNWYEIFENSDFKTKVKLSFVIFETLPGFVEDKNNLKQKIEVVSQKHNFKSNPYLKLIHELRHNQKPKPKP